MRRSFKAATVFAGTAVLAGGYVPTAHAASNTRLCGANDTGGISHWLHLFYPNNDHPAECTHGSGYEPAKGTITAYCPGGTKGWLYGTYASSPTRFAAVHFSAASNTRMNFYNSVGVRTNLNLSGISVHDTGTNQKCTS